MVTRASAILDTAMSATIDDVRALSFVSADPALDLPGYVRAGSAVRRWGRRLVVVQDDVHALALVDEATGVVSLLALPPGPDGRRTFGDGLGNKAFKMDLEACVTLPDGRLVALGSGSRPQRQRVVVVGGDEGVRVVDGGEFYEALRARKEFAGSELNVEGAIVGDDVLRLFQRGNGAPRDGLDPVDAVGDIDLTTFLRWIDGGPVPRLRRVIQIDLGTVGDVRFGFTDAARLPDGRIAFVAGAEDSPDTFRDGAILGCRFGVIDGDAVTMTDICDTDGASSRLKLEGIEWVSADEDGSWGFVVVSDMDAPDVPATLARLRVEGAPLRS